MPPFYYPTHSISLILSVTGAHVTKVSAFGYVDRNADAVFGKGNNDYDNPFSNESGLMHTSDGGCMRITEGRRLGLFNHSREVCLNMFYGTDACYEENSLKACYAQRAGRSIEDLSDLLDCPYFPESDTKYFDTDSPKSDEIDGYLGVSKIHPTHRLPECDKGLKTGHNGSHQFLVDDFVTACIHKAIPSNNVWESVRHCIPGIIGHESALKGGTLLDVPDFGFAPSDALKLEDLPFSGNIHNS